MTLKKEITFSAINELAGVTGYSPTPASQSLPEWYKKLARYFLPKLSENGASAKEPATIKACPPFLDAMMAGYVIKTETDLVVSWDEGFPVIRWPSGWTAIEVHEKEQIAKEQIPNGYSEQPLKFVNQYIIKTPPGYSSLIMHPLNRAELPFYTLAGIVETDSYTNPVNLPFLIRKDFIGTIPAGTPIAQILPIKRENWKSKNALADQIQLKKDTHYLHHTTERLYKKVFWQRKHYE